MPTPIKYRVTLTAEEQTELEALISKGKSAARKQTRARIILLAAEGKKDAMIAEVLRISERTIFQIRQRCVEMGPLHALEDLPRPGAKFKLDEKQCAHIIATACSEAPEGHSHWTLRLLADQVVQLGFADSMSHEAIRQLLKKHAETLAERGVVYSRGQR
jgi:transposase